MNRKRSAFRCSPPRSQRNAENIWSEQQDQQQQSQQQQHQQQLNNEFGVRFSRRDALLSSASVAATAVAAATGLLPGDSANAAAAAGCAASGTLTENGSFLSNFSAAAAVPVWEVGAATGNIKAAPEETSEYLGTTALEGLNSVETRALELNNRIQQQNAAPMDFPSFIRQGFNVKIIADGYRASPEGLVFRDYQVGDGAIPEDGQEVVFDYTAYNEQGRRIDSTYNKSAPARTRLGIQGLIPGFELGLRSMRVGGKRRLVVPPQLGPPTGPATFFSAKQCEVFDVELRAVRNCSRRQMGMFSDVVCE